MPAAPTTVSPTDDPAVAGSSHVRQDTATETHPRRCEDIFVELEKLPSDDARRGTLRSRLVEMNLPFARQLARRYSRRGEPVEDLEQAALVGLTKAINGYDAQLGHQETMEASAAYEAVSLDASLGDDPGEPTATLADTLGEIDHGLDLVVDHEALKPLVGELSARTRRILLMRFFADRTQAEIAGELGLSQMQISRILSQTLRWLRSVMLTEN